MNVNSGLAGCQKGVMPVLLLGLLMYYSSSFAQKITILPADGAFSRENSPQGALRYQRQMYLVTAAELLASGLPSASMINSIGFTLGAAQDSVTKGKFKVYLQNTTDTVSRTDTSWTYVSVTSNSYHATGLLGGNYEWQVYTNCPGSIYDTALSTFSSNIGTCNSPTSFRSDSITPTTAHLYWTAPISTVTKYFIQYSRIDSVSWILDSTSNTSYIASGLLSNKYYKWRVQTECNGGASFSSLSSVDGTFVTTTDAAPCNLPSGLLAGSTTDSTANVFWNSVSGATYYSIQYKRTGTIQWVGNISLSPFFTFSGLKAGTNYEWRVATHCADGTGVYVQGSNFTTTGTSICYAPGNASTDSITNTDAKLRWDPVVGATSYNVRYRLKESISWANAISPMTLVHNDSIKIPKTVGAYDVPFVNGTAFTYTGGGVYIAWEYSRPVGRLSSFNTVLCNSRSKPLLSLNTKNDTSNSGQLTVLTANQRRPETRFGSASVRDSVEVSAVYGSGEFAVPYSNNTQVSALIRNYSALQHTYAVTLKIIQQGSGTIRDSVTQNFTLHPDTSEVITFTTSNARAFEKDSLIVSIPAESNENVISNNTNFYLQRVNKFISAYDDSSAAITSAGTDSLAGLTLIRQNMNGCGKVNAAHIYLSASAKGHFVYAVVLNNLGTIVAKSDSIAVDSSMVNKYHSFYFPTPALIKSSDYYIGLAQSAALPGYFPVGVQWENKIVRRNAYYYAGITGTGLLDSPRIGRLMIRSEIIPGINQPVIAGKLSLCTGGTNTLTTYSFSERYANNVVAFSSQKGVNDFSAQRALGAPNVYPDSAASGNAWTSNTADSYREYLSLSFPDAAPVNYIDIYESFNPGAVDTVYVKNPISGNYDVVFSTTAHAVSPASRINHLVFPLTAYNVSEIRIALNSPAVPGFNFIDAVAIGKIDSISSYNFLWSTGATTQAISVNATGRYTVTVSDANSCSASASDSVFTPSHIPPTISASGPLTFCVGDSVTLTSSQLTGNTWSTGATTRSIIVKTAGSFTVGYDDGTGCGTTNSAATTTIVNALPVVHITGNLTICPGSSDTLNAGSGYNSYQWSTGETTQIITVPLDGTYMVTVINSNGCSGSASVTTTLGVAPTPTITGNTLFCPGSSTVLDAGAGYAHYLWSNGMNTRTITVTTADNFSVTVTNNAGCSGSATINTTQYSAPTPTITGATSFCPGSTTTLNAGSGYNHYAWSNNATTQTISVGALGIYTVTVTDAHGCTGSAGVTIGQYVAPSPVITGTLSFCAGGATLLDAGSGYNAYLWSTTQTTHSISVTVVGTYTVTVTDNHGCTGSTSATVNANGGPPSTPGPISGDSAGVCSSVGNVYSISPVPNTTRYVWIAPAGSAITSGQGTTTVHIIFGSSFGSGNIVVAAANACGQSPSYNPRILTVQGAPAVPGVITGQTTGLCGQTKTYSINAVHGALNYIWTVPTGATILTSTGTSITVSFISSFTSGNITVAASNACGQSSSATPRTLQVNGAPNPAGLITGQTTGLCNQAGVSYSIAAIPGATNYVWTAPVGATIIGGQGTSAIVVNFGGSFTSGSICVTPYSSSCNSAASCLAVSSKPALPTSIAGPSSVCSNQHVVFSVAPVAGATSYTWTVPSHSVITSGQGTNSISVTFGNRSGNVTVVANSACGNSATQTLAVSVTCVMSPVINPITSARNINSELLSPVQVLSVYPNPSSGYFQVHFDNNSSNYKMVITDAMNKTVFVRALQLKENYIDVDFSNLAKGVYIIKVFDAGNILTGKVIIQ